MATLQGIKPEFLKATIRTQFGSARKLAAHIANHPSTISRVLKDPSFSKLAEKKIAGALGMTPHQIWPDRWSEKNEPIRAASKADGNGKFHPRTSQKGRAA